MSATGLDVFDKTLQTTNIWLDELMQEIGPDRKTAWRVLAVVLHRLRNRLPIGLAANFGAQLPMLVRGLYYDQFEPAKQPSECDTMEQFRAEVAEWLQDNRPIDPDIAVKSVFKLLTRHISRGEIANVVHALPEDLRQAWPEEARQSAQEQNSEPQQEGKSRDSGQQSQGGRSAMFDTDREREKIEPASPHAAQTMTGGTDGSGPAR